jgi:hypothetical protein
LQPALIEQAPKTISSGITYNIAELTRKAVENAKKNSK